MCDWLVGNEVLENDTTMEENEDNPEPEEAANMEVDKMASG